MMPVFRPTADCIWKSFRSSQKKHLVLTGSRGSGKTTLFHALFPAGTEGPYYMGDSWKRSLPEKQPDQ